MVDDAHVLSDATRSALATRLSDERPSSSSHDHIVPRFDRDDYNGGVLAGVHAVRRQLGSAPALNRPPQPKESGGSIVAGVAFIAGLAAIAVGVTMFARRSARRNEALGGWYSAAVGGSDGGGSGGGFGGGELRRRLASGGW